MQEWRDRACLEQNGPEYEALGKLAQANKLYLSGNVYEIDPHFPQLYFQTCFIIGPNGNVILRYRRLTSCFEPTPHDVWDKYLDIYGEEGIFPVAKTEIGNLGTIASEEILYPEITRCLVMRGAEIILHPTSEPGSAARTIKETCRLARAIENQVFVVSANTASIDDTPIPPYTCSAMSKIVDFNGHILAEAAQGGEAFNSNAVIDVGALRRTRRRTAMANVMSRQPFDIYANSYAKCPVPPAELPAPRRQGDRAAEPRRLPPAAGGQYRAAGQGRTAVGAASSRDYENRVAAEAAPTVNSEDLGGRATACLH